MSARDLVKTSRLLSLVLRHQPAKLGLTLDASGWVAVETLLAALAVHGHPLSRAELAHLVDSNDKKRFAFSEDGTLIRANQGHSVTVDLALAAAVPPERLYHGTIAANLDSIARDGLRKGQRHAVHLSADRETAIRVGARRGQAVVLEVRAGDMAKDGFVFHCSENGVWLTDHVPAAYVERDGMPPAV